MTTDLLRLPQSNTVWFLLAACGVCTVAVATNVGSDVTSVALCASLSVVLPGIVIAQRVRLRGVIDPLGLFCFAFILYHAVLLVRVAMVGGAENLNLIYPVEFPNATFVHAGVVSAISALSIMLTALTVERTPGIGNTGKRQKPAAPAVNSSALFVSGIALYSLGILFFYLNASMLGGFIALFSLERTERYASFATQVTYPQTACLMAACVTATYSYLLRRTFFKGFMLVAMVGIWSAILLLQGDRRTLVNFAISIAGLYACLTGERIAVSRRLLLTFLTAFVALCFFANVRLLIPRIFSRNVSISEALALTQEKSADAQWLLPERTELAGPFLSLLYSVDSTDGPLYGRSYLESVACLLPRFLYPGERPQTISVAFSERVQDSYMQASKTAQGWGFSPFAEAYENFSLFGVVAISVMWTLGFSVLSVLPRQFGPGALFFAVLLPQAVNCNRNDFAAVLLESIHNSLFLCVALAISAVFDASKHSKHKNAV
jgi:hypothetical protein